MASLKEQAKILIEEIQSFEAPVESKTSILQLLENPSKEILKAANEWISNASKEETPQEDSNPQEEAGDTPESTRIAKMITEENTDFKSYIQYRLLEGTISESPLEMPQGSQQAFLRAYHKWIDAGKPRPKLPKSLQENGVTIIDKVYREKFYGEQYLWYITEDGKKHGKEMIPVYEKKEVDGEIIEDTDRIVKHDKKLSIKYNKREAEKLMEQTFSTSSNPRFYIIENLIKGEITNPKVNMFEDFDELMTKVKTGQTI